MKAKNYNIILLSSLLVFIIINYVVWNAYTERILPQDGTVVGDLVRMSYRIDICAIRENIKSTKGSHFIYATNIPQIDLITIGDSFSNGGGGGKYPYYQELISSRYKINVLNLQLIPGMNPIENVLVLLQTPEFEEMKPRYILLQSVERVAVQRFSNEVNWNIEVDEKSIRSLFSQKSKSEIPPQYFINVANIKYFIYNLLYNIDDNAYISMAYIVDLDTILFSSASGSKLSFYFEDINNVALVDSVSIYNLNNNLNILARILDEKGVCLIFMPTVNKLNLYHSHISSKSYPESTFFERLRKENHDYYFVDTKQILSKALELGIKDIYFSDDTHWSPIGRDLVVEDLKNVIE